MAVDMFLKIDGIKGESVDHKHKDEINLLSWSFGATNQGTHHVGGGGGAGKVNFSDITFTKHIDKSSPELLLHCANGKHIKSIELTCRKAGEKPVEYLKIKLQDALISSYNTGGSNGEALLTEHVSINFGRIDFTYSPQKVDGSADVGIVAAWDIAKNAKPA